MITYTDDFCIKMLSDPNKREALSWIKDGIQRGYSHTLGYLNELESKDVVKTLYSKGALNVFVVEIDGYPNGNENAHCLIIAMPENKEKRKEIFKYVQKHALEEEHKFEQEEDQMYLFMDW